MKMKILLLTMLIISGNILAQKKCKPSATSTIKTTGQTYNYYGDYMTPRLVTIKAKGIEWEAKVYIVNDTKLKVSYIQVVTVIPTVPDNYTNRGEEWYPPGTTFELFLENGEKLFFQSTETAFTKKYGRTYDAAQVAHITDEQINLLSTSKIVKFVIMPFLDIEKLPLTYKVKSSIGKKLMNQFNCYKETGYENTGKVANPRKASTYMKLADKYLKSKKYENAKKYYIKSIDELNDLIVVTKLNILNVFLENKSEENIKQIEKNLITIKKAEKKEENIEILEEMTLYLIGENPEIAELEEILLLLAN